MILSLERQRFVLAAVLTLVVGTTTPARADHVEYRDAAVGTGLRFPASFDVPAHVETQHIVLTCRDERGAPVCDFTATYRLANRGTETEDVVGSFYGRHLRNVRVTADGPGTSALLRPADRVGVEEQVHERLCSNLLSIVSTAAPVAECAFRVQQPLARWAHAEVALNLAPEETRSVSVTGTLEPGRSDDRDESWMPSRHPLLGHLAVARHDLDFWLASVGGVTEVEVRLPDGWDATVRSPSRAGEGRLEVEPWSLLREGDRNVARRRFKANELPEAVNVVIERSPSFLRRGGPLVGVGGAVGTAAGLRMRMGYELALATRGVARATLASLSVDTDWNKLAIVTPGLGLALPLFVPSLGLGLGLPVVVAPERRVGVRGMAGVHVWGVGFVASYDWLPETANASRSQSQWTLLGQVSF